MYDPAEVPDGPVPDDLTEGQKVFVGMLREDAENRFRDGDLGALSHSVAHKPDDPAFWMLLDGKTSTTSAPYRDYCYICRDPEYAAMGLPLCYQCARCGGHIAADDENCDDCGWCINPYNQRPQDGLEGVQGPEGDDDWHDPRFGLGDFETSEPFLVVTGTGYQGMPETFGDFDDKDAKNPGDYVENMAGPRWRGTVTSVSGHHAFTSWGPEGKTTAGEFYPTDADVRIDEPRPGVAPGEIVKARHGHLRVIRRAS